MTTIIVFLHSGCTNTENVLNDCQSFFLFLVVFFFFFPVFCSREVLQEVLDTDLSNEGFPFSSHKVVIAAGHQVTALTHPLHAHTHVHDGCSTSLCFKITLSVLVKWRMQLIKNATMQIACCWVKRYFLFFFYLKGSVIKDCTLCRRNRWCVSRRPCDFLACRVCPKFMYFFFTFYLFFLRPWGLLTQNKVYKAVA